MLRTMDSSALWTAYYRTRSEDMRSELIRRYTPLARKAADRMQFTPWGCVTREDLQGHAFVGLIDAVDRFDPSQGVPFEGYALPRIRGSVIDALRRLDWMPRTLRSEETRYRSTYGRLEANLGRPPSDNEVSREMGIDGIKLDELKLATVRSSVSSLEDLVAGMFDGSGAGEEILSSDDGDPYSSRLRTEAAQRLRDALESLPEREKLVVSLYYYRGLTLKEIGQVIGVSEQRVSQLHSRAVGRMKQKLVRHSELVCSLAA